MVPKEGPFTGPSFIQVAPRGAICFGMGMELGTYTMTGSIISNARDLTRRGNNACLQICVPGRIGFPFTTAYRTFDVKEYDIQQKYLRTASMGATATNEPLSPAKQIM